MYDETIRYVIVYNGDLYNYALIKKQLLKKGCKFYSQTDTEVFLKYIYEWGENCFNIFIGMFGFIVVDNQKEKAFFVRDHLGIKPLYLYYHINSIYISNEIKVFKAISNLEIETNNMFEHFLFRYVSGKNTLY